MESVSFLPARCFFCRSDDATIIFRMKHTDLVRCNSCGLKYFNRQLPPRQLKQIYAGDYFKNQSLFSRDGSDVYGYFDYLADAKYIERVFTKYANLIAKYKSPGKILEIGSAYGIFLRIMKSRGWTAYGIEPNREAAEFAKNNFNLNIFPGLFEEICLKDSTFDVVALFDVVEHLPDPGQALTEIHRVLKPGGLILVGTIDSDAWVARLLGSKWEDLRRYRAHLWLFSRSTVRSLLERTGFEIIRIFPYGRWFELEFVLRRVVIYSPRLFLFLIKIVKILHLSQIPIYINPRTKLLIFARKTA